MYAELQPTVADSRVRALIGNDLAVLDALAGDLDAARLGLEAPLALDAQCQPARLNLALLRAEPAAPGPPPIAGQRPSPAARVAILSFLFNWPATGGGNIHTVELVPVDDAALFDAVEQISPSKLLFPLPVIFSTPVVPR